MITKILFLKFGNFSNINNMVFQILESEYSEYQIETLDALELLKHKTSIYQLLYNIPYFIKEYGIEIIKGEKKWQEIPQWFFATSYITVIIEKKIKKINKDKEYKFTLQTQSIFNGKIEGIPHFIYTDHTNKTNLLYPGIKPSIYMRSKKFTEKCEVKIYKDANMVFTFGSLVAYSLVTQYQIEKEKVLPVFSGSNVKYEIDFNPQKYFLKNILFVGVEWERKGGPILLKIFEEVQKVHPDASLTIVGCSPKNIKLPNCNVIGKVPLEKVAEYYKNASVFCLPTLREPFGVVFVEAMSFKLPIVANNIGCIPDLVKNDYNGYLINNNVIEYSKVICDLFNNPLKCKKMGENGYENVKTIFNWDVVGKLIKENINRSLEGSS